jgi:hypothetical protein
MGRERRLRIENLVEVLRGFGKVGPLCICTKLGLCATGRRELRPAKVSLPLISHETTVAALAASIERGGQALLSEREMFACERAAGEPLYSASLSGERVHRADLLKVAEDGGPGEAIEVELTMKGAARLDELLRGWRRAVVEKRVAGVVYYCTPRTLRHVKRAVERTKTNAVVSVREI